MIRHSSIITGLLVSACAAHAECSLEQVRMDDRALNDAIVDHDAARARHFYADAFVLTTSHGSRKHVDDMIRDVGDRELSFSANSTHDTHVIGDGRTAVLYGGLHQSGSFHGQPFDVELRVTDTWTCEGDRWRLLAGHASPVTK